MWSKIWCDFTFLPSAILIVANIWWPMAARAGEAPAPANALMLVYVQEDLIKPFKHLKVFFYKQANAPLQVLEYDPKRPGTNPALPYLETNGYIKWHEDLKEYLGLRGIEWVIYRG